MKRVIVSLLLVGCVGGCAYRPYLAASPNFLRHRDADQFFAHCAQEEQSPIMDVLYVTDRSVECSPKGVKYGYGRAKRMGFGTAQVSFDPSPTWKELIRESVAPNRRQALELKMLKVEELGCFDPQLERLEYCDQGFQLCNDAKLNLHEQQKHLHQLVQNRLACNPQKDVYVFIHGVNNTFEDAVIQAAQVWHFTGRVGVPICYTWPAGFGGLRGYAYDRESGEFTVFHLKNFLKTLAACPGVERIHLIAHSRGADVTISALRELHTGYVAAGQSTQKTLKLENLILAAPDLDEDVFMQRFVAENLVTAAKRTTIYASTSDRVIELADVVFGSRKRLGLIGPRDFSPKVRQMLSSMPNLQFVECRVSDFSGSHNYIYAHPAALSDLILVLRECRDPGPENGRPLRQSVQGVWELDNSYWQEKESTPKMLEARP